jgi:hypothetical protein
MQVMTKEKTSQVFLTNNLHPAAGNRLPDTGEKNRYVEWHRLLMLDSDGRKRLLRPADAGLAMTVLFIKYSTSP